MFDKSHIENQCNSKSVQNRFTFLLHVPGFIGKNSSSTLYSWTKTSCINFPVLWNNFTFPLMSLRPCRLWDNINQQPNRYLRIVFFFFYKFILSLASFWYLTLSFHNQTNFWWIKLSHPVFTLNIKNIYFLNAYYFSYCKQFIYT